ncbi:tol-Pal system protein TolA-like [Eriocheir sinensis]|uniref:tol-Pal system protein TolA-like n=1 Tax=Eriocheir sinensis TaxID=95602 RepID=UPI0021C6F469|nr:tol-Pal system protein TolA-like [Eriocheir sinensis]
MKFYFFPGGGPPPPPLDPIDELVGDVLGQDSKVITGFEEIDDLGHQRTVDIEDAAEPASQLFVGQGGVEAPTVIIVPEPTLQPQTEEGGARGKVPAEGDAAAAQAKVAAAEEEAVASRATAAAAQAGEEAARAMKAAAEEVAACARAFAGAARVQEAAARAQEAAVRAQEAAAKEKAEAMRLKQILLKLCHGKICFFSVRLSCIERNGNIPVLADVVEHAAYMNQLAHLHRGSYSDLAV